MVHLIVGLIMAGLGIWGVIAWWSWFGLVMRGVVPFCLILFGLLAVLSGARRESRGGENGLGPELAHDRHAGGSRAR